MDVFSFKKMVFKDFLIFFLTKKCSKYRMFLSFFIFFCITPLPNSAGGVEYSSLSPWETLGERAWRPEEKARFPLTGACGSARLLGHVAIRVRSRAQACGAR